MWRAQVKIEEVRREKQDFSHSRPLPLFPSPTLSLSQLKIQNSLTVKCSIVQSHRYPLKNLALHNSGMILIVLRDGPMSPRACIFTAGGTPNPYSRQKRPQNGQTQRILISAPTHATLIATTTRAFVPSTCACSSSVQ